MELRKQYEQIQSGICRSAVQHQKFQFLKFNEMKKKNLLKNYITNVKTITIGLTQTEFCP